MNRKKIIHFSAKFCVKHTLENIRFTYILSKKIMIRIENIYALAAKINSIACSFTKL